MAFGQLLLESLWASLFALVMGVIFTVPRDGLLFCALCGFVGRFVRDLLTSVGADLDLATFAGASALAVIALSARRQEFSAVALISGVLPLGASLAMFNTISGLLRIPTLKGELLAKEVFEMIANASKAFSTTLFLALGLALVVVVSRQFRPRKNDAYLLPSRSEDGEKKRLKKQELSKAPIPRRDERGCEYRGKARATPGLIEAP